MPAADGSDLEGWLKAAQSDLEPFVERLFDEMLVGMVLGLKIAADSWESYAEMAIQGNRVGAVTALTQATDAVSTISPTLAGWLNQLRTIVNNATYIERHALYGVLGRALADGWENFDRGRLARRRTAGRAGVRDRPHRHATAPPRAACAIWPSRRAIGSSATASTTPSAPRTR